MTKEDILYRFKDINLYYNDCTAYDNLSRMLDDLISSSIAAGAALVTTGISEINGKWIPVSERLPEDGEWAIFTDGKHKSIERYKEDALDHFYPAGRWFELEDAVAWWPLPEEMFSKEDEN